MSFLHTRRTFSMLALRWILLGSIVLASVFASASYGESGWSALLEECSQAVVLIEAPLDEELCSHGSGALISPDGYILTAQHVIEDALSITVIAPATETDEFVSYDATLVSSSVDADIAVLKIEGVGHPFLPLGDSDSLKLEEEIRLLGYPVQQYGLGLIIGRGFFLGSRDSLDVDGVTHIQIDVDPFDHGHSGGPVINAAGQIVGVAVKYVWTGDESEAQKHKLAVSINTARRFIPSSAGGLGEATPSGVARGPAPTTWEIFGYTSEYLYVIQGDPAAFPTPMPRKLPVEWTTDIIVGSDGQFYCTDPRNNKIVRFDPRTRETTVILEGSTLYPYALSFDPEGNLVFSTYDKEGRNEGDSMGIWRIALAEPDAEPERIIPGSLIQECGVKVSTYRFSAPPVFALVAGPYCGDILVGGRGTAISRAIAPDYTQVVPFIQVGEFSFPTGEDPIPDALGDLHQDRASGHVFATDFVKNRIFEFDSDGSFIRIFADLFRANRITSDYAGNIYATGAVFGRHENQHIAGFTPDGTQLFALSIPSVQGIIILEE